MDLPDRRVLRDLNSGTAGGCVSGSCAGMPNHSRATLSAARPRSLGRPTQESFPQFVRYCKYMLSRSVSGAERIYFCGWCFTGTYRMVPIWQRRKNKRSLVFIVIITICFIVVIRLKLPHILREVTRHKIQKCKLMVKYNVKKKY